MEPLALKEAIRERAVRVGRYEVLRLLGEGGMGDVYEALDTEHGGRVALKTLRDCDVSPDRLLLFKNEFHAVADLSHKNLVPLYELSYHEGLWFFTMERIEGIGLAEGLRKTVDDADGESHTLLTVQTQPTLAASPNALSGAPKADNAPSATSVETVVCDMDLFTHAIAQVLDGLEYLHQQGVVHQDIKPSNILIDLNRVVRVLDFGLAHRIGRSMRLRKDGAIGTPAYMAPELWRGEPATPESDLFALGCVMFQLLTGQLPFAEKSIHARRAPRVDRVARGTPKEIADVCHRLLSRLPGARPSIAEVRAALGVPQPHAPEGLAAVRFVGRTSEQEALLGALDRVCEGASVSARVEGGSGVGKSALVRSFFQELRGREDVLALRGRCYERESVPYKAFDGMIDALAVRLSLYSEEEQARVRPPWLEELSQVFPVLPKPKEARAPDAISALELRRRVLEALYQLFAQLAAQQPLVLEIDDLQWADADSLSLLWKILREAPPRLLLVLSLRPKEAAENPDVALYLEAIQALPAARSLSLRLGPLAKEEAEELARRTLWSLGLPEASSGHIARESGGVPFFVEELAYSIAQQRGAGSVLRLSEALAERVRALSAPERALVELLSVANNPIPRAVACQAAGLEGNVLSVLNALHRNHFVQRAGVRAEDRLGIYHDRMRESVLAYLSEARIAALHLALGRTLSAWMTPEAPGSWLFDATRHLRAAASLLRDPAERLAAARLHLLAGRQARQAASFPLAFRCFEDGIFLLPEGAWEREYETCLGLYAGAAEAAYLNAMWPVMEERIAQVKEHSRSLVDQLPVWVVQIDALAGRHEYLDAIETGLESLRLLGVHLPTDPSEAEVGAAFGRALEGLSKIGPAGLAALPDTQDPLVLAAMRIQVRLCPVAFFVRQRLLALMACNLVVTSIERGLSTATPNALSLFGLILNTVGMFPVSHGWGQLAIQLIERWEDRSLEAATRHVVFNFVCPWMVPLQSILRSSREVFDIGQRTGDFEYGSYAAQMYTYMALFAGKPLQPLLEDALSLGAQMRSFGQLNAIHIHAPFEQFLKCLTGAKEEPWSLDDEGFTERGALATAEATGSRSGLCVQHIAIGLARFYFGSAKEASRHLERARPYLDSVPSCWLIPLCHQFAGLAACACWHELEEDERATLRPKIEESLGALRKLSGFAPTNFAHRVSLLEGELLRIDGALKGALVRFEEARKQAAENGWWSEIALAHELMERALLLTARPEEAAYHRQKAQETYAQWGARAKAAFA